MQIKLSMEYFKSFNGMQNRIIYIVYHTLKILLSANELIALERISVKEQFLKILHCLQTNDWYWIKLVLFDRNNLNHLTM